MLIIWLWEFILPFFNYHPGHAQLVSRLTVIGILCFVTIFILNRQKHRSDLEIFTNSLVLLTVMFLISPTQFPWYFVWLIPFLTIKPNFALLLLTALLPMYYLRFYFEQKNMLPVFNNVVVWIEFIPVWILLILQWFKYRRYDLNEAKL